MTDRAPELRIAVAAYEAATDPSKWKVVLRELADRCGAAKAALFTPLEGARERFLWSDIGMDPSLLEDYSKHWVREDAWTKVHRERGMYTAGRVTIGSDYLPWDRLERTAFYNEFCVHVGVKGLISAVLYDENDAAIAPPTHISLFREPGAPEFGHEHARLLMRVQPHLRRAIELYWGLEKARALPDAIKQALEGVPQPVFVLRADGFIEHANAAGSALLSQEGLLRVKNGRLVAVADDHRGWATALRELALGTGCVLPFTHVRGHSTHSGVMRLAPVRENPGYAMVWPAAAAVATVQLHDGAQRDGALARLAARYMFTPTEVRILRLLAEGHGPAGIAEALQLRISTVRTHLRNLFDKTGLRRQVDLVRLIAG